MYDFSSMNEAQRRAAMHGEGPMLVLAGPGSGKTFTITNRISYLIEECLVPPEHILVITFTKEAAQSMQKRFQAAQRMVLPVNFGTFHAVFYQMIRRSGCCSTDHILTDSGKRKLILPILEDYHREKTGSSDGLEEAQKILGAISYYKNTGNAEKAAGLLTEPYKSDFLLLLQRYEKRRKQQGGLDFDDMLYLCRQMLEQNRQCLAMWREQFQFFLIDEFQDINPIQYDIIRLLAAPHNNLFAVGDDDQSIYGFRGSEPSLMKRMLSDLPGCEQVLLNYNYRSRPQIVEASLKVVSENKERFVKELKAFRKSECEEGSPERTVSLKGFSEKAKQYDYIVEKLQGQQESGAEKLSCCAVLFRTNSQLQGFASWLTRAGLPFQMKEKAACIYDHFIARDVRDFLSFAGGERSRAVFLRIMNKPSRYLSREAVEGEQVEFEQIRQWYRKYMSGRQLTEILFGLKELEEGIRQLAMRRPYLALQYLRKRMGYEAYLRKKAGLDQKKLSEWMEFLEVLCQEAREYAGFQDWFAYQDIFREEMERTVQKGKQGEGVHLMTAHASKGLEFEAVWIPDANEGTFPHGRLPEKEALEEERRMFYVAMTRAKDALEITFVTGTKERPGRPSRFLNPLLADGAQEAYCSSSTISSNSQLSRYSSKASATASYSSSSSMKPSTGSSLGSSMFSL